MATKSNFTTAEMKSNKIYKGCHTEMDESTSLGFIETFHMTAL